MTSTARGRLAELLSEQTKDGSFSASRTAPAGGLRVEVRGVGEICLPVSQAQARQLCASSRPARYGRKEQTLVDRTVRDTWEVPKSRVKIDQRRWKETLDPVLEQLKTDLGLPAATRLRAELHSMLVYAPGQFFLPHQDSEKHDTMVGSLVVGLPSAFSGGALEVRQGAEAATYRGSKKSLSFVAFYSDCQHQIKPVTSGYRVVLTYDLLAVGETRRAVVDADCELIGGLAGCLEEHFGGPEAPRRLVYLLDHQYTQRAVSWSRLKGGDARTAALLQTAAERAGCDAVLALVDVHETWSAYEPEPPSRWYRHSSYEDWDDDEDDEDGSVDSDDAGDYDLQELIESEITLHSWIDPTGTREEDLGLSLSDDEVCTATPSEDLEPYSSEYEGYMGNWGNTLDRWYHRGAIAMWPRHQAFGVRAEAAPNWALDTLTARLRKGDLQGGRDMAARLAPFWERVAGRVRTAGFFTKALRAARLVEDPDLAATLLGPFHLQMLTHTHAKAFSALLEAYGEDWTAALVAKWSPTRRYYSDSTDQNTEAWMAALPQLCDALGHNGGAGAAAARLVLADAKQWAAKNLKAALGQSSPTRRDKDLSDLGQPVAAVICAATLAGAGDLRDELIRLVCSDAGGVLHCAIAVLRATPRSQWTDKGLGVLTAHVRATLGQLLGVPQRSAGDWSIQLPPGCECELCSKLSTFLADPTRTRFEWPLREDGRAHVHRRIDASELPVNHQTRRSGRPYTLVLAKTEALFESDRQARRYFETTLAWLEERPGGR